MENLTREQKLAKQDSELAAMRDHQKRVAAGDAEPELVEANLKKGHMIRAFEASKYVFLFTRKKHVDEQKKEFINEDRVIKIHAANFKRLIDTGAFNAYDHLEVYHDPRKDRPETYVLKAVTMAGDRPLTSSDKSIIERENRISAREANLEKRDKEISEKLASMGEMEAKLKEKFDELIKAQEQAETKQKAAEKAAKEAEAKEQAAKEQEAKAKAAAKEAAKEAEKPKSEEPKK